MATPDVLPVRDPDAAHAIPTAWRSLLSDVVHALVAGDFHFEQGPAGVDEISPETASHMKAYLEDYDASLVELPEASWDTSVAQWMDGYWDVLVDLWTAEEGRSDLVLEGQMRETEDGLRFSIHMVYVP